MENVNMQTLPLRIGAGQDLRAVLDALVAQHHVEAAFVLQGIGSLTVARLRFAGRSEFTELRGNLEILTLGGSLSPDGPHLHVSVADDGGRVLGGHLGPGCLVRTTAEVLVALLPRHRFRREFDPATGFDELFVKA